MSFSVLILAAGEGKRMRAQTPKALHDVCGRPMLRYVLDAAKGTVVREIRCGEPIFSSPVVSGGRVYFATLGARVYAVETDGRSCWTWDYVREVLGFTGDRWSGAHWARHKGHERVRRQDMFCCSRDLAAFGKTVVVPAGGSVVWLTDAGGRAEVRALHQPHTTTFALSLGEDAAAYRQWHWLDNRGGVEVLRLREGKVEVGEVPGTRTHAAGAESVSVSSVSVRDGKVYRCRPEEGFGLCRHTAGAEPQAMGGYPSICPPVLAGDRAVYGGLDGRLYVVPLAGGRSWKTRCTKRFASWGSDRWGSGAGQPCWA